MTVIVRGEMGRDAPPEGFGDGDGRWRGERDRRKWSEESWMGSGIVVADRVIEAACTCFDAGVGVSTSVRCGDVGIVLYHAIGNISHVRIFPV